MAFDDLAPQRLLELPSWLLSLAAAHGQTIVTDACADEGFLRLDFRVLAALDDIGPTSQATLGRRMRLDRSDLHAVVTDLEGRGLIEQEHDPTDRRRYIVQLTAAGTEALGRVIGAVAHAQDELTAPLSADERTELTRLLRKLADHHGEAAPPRTMKASGAR